MLALLLGLTLSLVAGEEEEVRHETPLLVGRHADLLACSASVLCRAAACCSCTRR